jgi:hypothetical protein
MMIMIEDDSLVCYDNCRKESVTEVVSVGWISCFVELSRLVGWLLDGWMDGWIDGWMRCCLGCCF